MCVQFDPESARQFTGAEAARVNAKTVTTVPTGTLSAKSPILSMH
jgi:hypothetical protein